MKATRNFTTSKPENQVRFLATLLANVLATLRMLQSLTVVVRLRLSWFAYGCCLEENC